MDGTESGMGRHPARSGSQARIPPVLLWVFGAAVVLRIVTLLVDREGPDAGAGLVHWWPVASASNAARMERRPLLYDFTAAWCSPCHRLDQEGWGDARIAGMVNRSYVPVRIVDRQREDGKNSPSIEALQRKYKIQGFPTLVIAAVDGAEIGRSVGYGGRDALAKFLEKPGESSRGAASAPPK
jgi:thioredoxin-related protein